MPKIWYPVSIESSHVCLKKTIWASRKTEFFNFCDSNHPIHPWTHVLHSLIRGSQGGENDVYSEHMESPTTVKGATCPSNLRTIRFARPVVIQKAMSRGQTPDLAIEYRSSRYRIRMRVRFMKTSKLWLGVWRPLGKQLLLNHSCQPWLLTRDSSLTLKRKMKIIIRFRELHNRNSIRKNRH